MKPFLVFLAMVLLFSGCTSPTLPENTGSGSNMESNNIVTAFDADKVEPESFPIQILTPVVFSEYTFYRNRESVTLYLEMIEGVYDYGQNFWNHTWKGTFQFRVITGTSKYNSDAKETVSKPFDFSFDGPFKLSVADYNGDGDFDFLLGKWGALSRGDDYTIYTIRENGAVEALDIQGDLRSEEGKFLIPYTHEVSPLLELTENGFYTQYVAARGFEAIFTDESLYLDWFEKHPKSNPFDCYIRDYYEWQGTHFQLTHQEILPRN